MIQTELTVQNQLGLHARVASCIVRQAKTFTSEIYISKNEKKYNLKSAIGVITANAKYQNKLCVVFDGPDEQAASQAIAQLFVQKFGEE